MMLMIKTEVVCGTLVRSVCATTEIGGKGTRQDFYRWTRIFLTRKLNLLFVFLSEEVEIEFRERLLYTNKCENDSGGRPTYLCHACSLGRKSQIDK